MCDKKQGMEIDKKAEDKNEEASEESKVKSEEEAKKKKSTRSHMIVSLDTSWNMSTSSPTRKVVFADGSSCEDLPPRKDLSIT